MKKAITRAYIIHLILHNPGVAKGMYAKVPDLPQAKMIAHLLDNIKDLPDPLLGGLASMFELRSIKDLEHTSLEYDIEEEVIESTRIRTSINIS